MRIFILNFLMGFFSSEFLSRSFFHRTTRNLFGDFLLRRLLTDFRGCDLSGRCRYPLRLEKVPQISQIYTDFSWDVFCHADFADDADFFHRDFIHRMTRNLFEDFLLRRLLTDFRRCDLSGRCRYPLRLEKVPQISQMTQIFHRDFFIGRHGIYSEISCCGDYSRIFADATCPVVADTP